MKKNEWDSFFSEQLQVWPDAAARFVSLQSVQLKQFEVDGCPLTVQYNPARIVSTSANIKTEALKQRPCFLCAENRPSQQYGKSLLGEYTLLVNPFPILPQHFTIPLNTHRPQAILHRYKDMMRLTQLLSSYFLFYNGPRCGASAPDHMHLQAGSRNVVPLQRDFNKLYRPCLQHSHISGVDYITNYVVPVYAIIAHTPEESNERFIRLYHALPLNDGDTEPMMNILSWMNSSEEGHEELICLVIPRRLHRPSCYSATGPEQMLISPGALDMAGLMITPRQEDFQRISSQDIKSILTQVAAPKIPSQQLLRVGLIQAHQLRFHLHAQYRCNDDKVQGPQEVKAQGGQIIWNGHSYSQLLFEPQYEQDIFSIEEVVIGIQFHWEQRETQTFTGKLLLLPTDDPEQLFAINILPIETYLVSVISSEMNANAPLEFLKAHAVIARSWLLAAPKGHTLFDVCADDHCQRYQGLTRVTNINAQRAVQETEGMVLIYQGQICDARYSKCCGGQTEEFETCWNGPHHPYLESVSCPFCGQAHEDILSQVLNSYDQTTSDFFLWTVSYEADELSELLSRRLHTDFGEIIDLVPLQRGPSGRISQLRIVGEKTSLTIGSELVIRRALSESHLYSSNFEVERTEDNRFVLHGKGWGHGVGLCQIGAAVMAQQGYSCQQILEHYYKGTTLTSLNHI